MLAGLEVGVSRRCLPLHPWQFRLRPDTLDRAEGAVGGSACLRSGPSPLGAEDVPTGQVKVGIGGEGGTSDLRDRRSLEGRLALLKAGGAIIRNGVESQDRFERPAVNQALARVAARLKAQRVEVRSPGKVHAQEPVSLMCAVAEAQQANIPRRVRFRRLACGTQTPRQLPTTARTARCRQSSRREIGSATPRGLATPARPVGAREQNAGPQ
jgi:hypothetical protein